MLKPFLSLVKIRNYFFDSFGRLPSPSCDVIVSRHKKFLGQKITRSMKNFQANAAYFWKAISETELILCFVFFNEKNYPILKLENIQRFDLSSTKFRYHRLDLGYSANLCRQVNHVSIHCTGCIR